MARAATTSDAFNAVAEPRRREILDALATGEMAVSDLVEMLGMSQPLVSKHLKVLKDVDLVGSRTAGRQRFYHVNAAALQPVHAWVSGFEAMWNEHLDRFDEYVTMLKEERERRPR
jgi:DNA-binding transcriptional ArsR family regulator